MTTVSQEEHYTKIDTGEDNPRPIFETVVEHEIPKTETFKNQDFSELKPDYGNDQVVPEEASPPPLTPSINIPTQPLPEHEGSNFKIYLILGIVMLLVVGLSFLIFRALSNRVITSTPIKLIYWGLWEEPSVIEPMIAQFNRTNKNIIVEYSKQDSKNYREKIIARSKDGRGPDIFKFHNTWLPMMQDELSSIPKKVMTNDEFEKTFYKVIQEDLKVGSNYYGIPLYIDDLVLLYNNDFFKRVGITSPPKTWDELIVYAKQLTVPGTDGQPVTSGIALGTANNIEHFSDIFGWMLLQNGASLSNVASIEGQQVLSSYRKFAELPSPIWSSEMPNSVAAFASGQVAMIFAPSWEVANIKAINSELDLKVAPLPILPGEKEPFSIANYWIDGVSRSSKHQDEAWQFLKFLSSKDSMAKMYELQTKARGVGEAYSRVDLKDTLLQNDYNAPVIAQAPYLKSIPTISRTYDNGLNDQINSYLEDAVNSATEGVSYSDAMEKAKEGINSVLGKYKIITE